MQLDVKSTKKEKQKTDTKTLRLKDDKKAISVLPVKDFFGFCFSLCL